jgi:DNA gyrase/topoisomerase IV subunit A
VAIFTQFPIKTLSKVEIKASELLKLTSIGRVYIESVNKVPDHIWAEIDQTLDEMIELIPPDEPRKR